MLLLWKNICLEIIFQKEENLNNLCEQLVNDKLLNLLNDYAINKISEESTSKLRKGQ